MKILFFNMIVPEKDHFGANKYRRHLYRSQTEGSRDKLTIISNEKRQSIAKWRPYEFQSCSVLSTQLTLKRTY